MERGLAECLYYKGVYYDVGTVVKLRTKWDEEIITTFLGGRKYEGVCKYDFYFLDSPETYIIEIIKPVYYTPPQRNASKTSSIWTRSGSGSSTSSDEIAIGLIWYIAVMLVAIIFKDRLLIWIAATIIFFAWKHTK
jgi:hypothetical protein